MLSKLTASKGVAKALPLVLAALALLATTAVANSQSSKSAKRYGATLRPVPHDPAADNGSNVKGKVHLKLRGNRLTVKLRARGLDPLPHAMHIHGKDSPEVAHCPGANRRDDLVDDGLIETVEGLPDYGAILVSLTTKGGTTPDDALALDRFPVAKKGKLRYKRTVTIPSELSRRVADLEVVVHGEDLNNDGQYGGRTTKLGAPLEAELPVACGDLSRTRR
jgi:hypothetical protein